MPHSFITRQYLLPPTFETSVQRFTPTQALSGTHRSCRCLTSWLSYVLSFSTAVSRSSSRSATWSRRFSFFREERYVSPRTSPAPTANKKPSAIHDAPFCTALGVSELTSHHIISAPHSHLVYHSWCPHLAPTQRYVNSLCIVERLDVLSLLIQQAHSHTRLGAVHHLPSEESDRFDNVLTCANEMQMLRKLS